jgi:hypothetical protein
MNQQAQSQSQSRNSSGRPQSGRSTQLDESDDDDGPLGGIQKQMKEGVSRHEAQLE